MKLLKSCIITSLTLLSITTLAVADGYLIRTYTVSGDSGWSCSHTPFQACQAADAAQDAECQGYNGLPDHAECAVTERGTAQEDSRLGIDWGEWPPSICTAYRCLKPQGKCKCYVLVRDSDGQTTGGGTSDLVGDGGDDLEDILEYLQLDL